MGQRWEGFEKDQTRWGEDRLQQFITIYEKVFKGAAPRFPPRAPSCGNTKAAWHRRFLRVVIPVLLLAAGKWKTA